MKCNDVYAVCKNSGFSRLCVCEKNEVITLSKIAAMLDDAKKWIERNKSTYEKLLRKRPKFRCLYHDTVIRNLKGMIKCFIQTCENKELQKYCPQSIICNEEYLIDIYRTNGVTLKHPDVVIVKARGFTIIIERKSYGVQNRSEFESQIESSYMNLPEHLREPCTFVAYVPRGGGTLPIGFHRHQQLHLLMRDTGKRPSIYGIPVLVIEPVLVSLVNPRDIVKDLPDDPFNT